MDAAGIESGPVFRCINKGSRISADALTTEAAALAVKCYAARQLSIDI